jgi:hypothetical protein
VVNLSAAGVDPGDTVQIRFAIGRDGCGAGVEGSGWYVDNVKLVSCIGRAVTDTKVKKYEPQPVPQGRSFEVKVKVTADKGTPKGKVRIKKDGKVIGTAKLDDGIAWVKVTRNFKPGNISLVAKYVGNKNFKPSTDKFKVRVVRR